MNRPYTIKHLMIFRNGKIKVFFQPKASLTTITLIIEVPIPIAKFSLLIL